MIKCVVSSPQFVQPTRSKLQFFHDCLHLLIMLVATYNSFRTIALFPN